MTDDELVAEMRSQFLSAANLAKQARERGITVHLWDGGTQTLIMRDGAELKVLAEKSVKL